MESVFTSDGVINGLATIRSVERYDLVKIKTTELEAEPPFSDHDSVAYGLVKTYCWSWKQKQKNTPVRSNTVQFQALILVGSSTSTFNNLVFTGS